MGYIEVYVVWAGDHVFENKLEYDLELKWVW